MNSGTQGENTTITEIPREKNQGQGREKTKRQKLGKGQYKNKEKIRETN